MTCLVNTKQVIIIGGDVQLYSRVTQLQWQFEEIPGDGDNLWTQADRADYGHPNHWKAPNKDSVAFRPYDQINEYKKKADHPNTDGSRLTNHLH